MKVQAKCTTNAWDNMASRSYCPGEECEIDHDGPLASLKVGKEFVFKFDRTMAGTGQSPALGGFVCKGCGQAFDTFNLLGTHTREQHRTVFNSAIEDPAEPQEEDNTPIVLENRGKKPKTFKCKTCGEAIPNLYAMRIHNKTHVKVETAETVPVPA